LFKKSEEKKYHKKSLKRNHYQKIYETILYERISKETFPAKRLEEESLPKNVRRHFKQNLFDDDMYLTKNSLKRNPSKKYWTKHVYHNFSEEKSVQSNFREKPPQKK